MFVWWNMGDRSSALSVVDRGFRYSFVAEFRCGTDLILNLAHLEFWKSIRGAYYRWGAVWTFSLDLKRSFGWESFVGVAIGLRYFIVVDVVVFLVLYVTDLEFRKSICGAHFRWGAVWAVSPRLSFRAYRQAKCPCGNVVSPGLLVVDELIELTRNPSFPEMRLLGLYSLPSSRRQRDNMAQYDPRLSQIVYEVWQVISDFSCCCGDLWGAELEAHSPVLQLGLLRRGGVTESRLAYVFMIVYHALRQ
ncbi:hypothetical protein GIB67_014277, partial [Kingdonia uniflora]